MDNVNRKARAERRRQSAVLVRSKLQVFEDDLTPIRGVDAISLVWPLTLESWSLARLDNPSYERATTPYRFMPGRLT
jgi:hypothetical protein